MNRKKHFWIIVLSCVSIFFLSFSCEDEMEGVLSHDGEIPVFQEFDQLPVEVFNEKVVGGGWLWEKSYRIHHQPKKEQLDEMGMIEIGFTPGDLFFTKNGVTMHLYGNGKDVVQMSHFILLDTKGNLYAPYISSFFHCQLSFLSVKNELRTITSTENGVYVLSYYRRMTQSEYESRMTFIHDYLSNHHL